MTILDKMLENCAQAGYATTKTLKRLPRQKNDVRRRRMAALSLRRQ